MCGSIVWPGFGSANRSIRGLKLPGPTPVSGLMRTIRSPAIQDTVRASAASRSLDVGFSKRSSGEDGEMRLKGNNKSTARERLRNQCGERTATNRKAAARPKNPPREAASVTASKVTQRHAKQTIRSHLRE